MKSTSAEKPRIDCWFHGKLIQRIQVQIESILLINTNKIRASQPQQKPSNEIEAKLMPNSNQKLIARCLYAHHAKWGFGETWALI